MYSTGDKTTKFSAVVDDPKNGFPCKDKPLKQPHNRMLLYLLSRSQIFSSNSTWELGFQYN